MVRIQKILCVSLPLLLAAPLFGQTETTQAQYEKLTLDYFDYFEREVADSAEMALRKAILLMPDNAANFLLQANLAELVVSRKDTAEAVSLLSEALSAHPEMDDIRNRRAELFEKRGRTNEALADLEFLISKNPDNEVYRYLRALVLIREKLWNGAASDLEHIIKNNPQGYLPRVTLAATDFERGLELEAEKALSLLITEQPTLHVASRVLTGIYLREGRFSEAHATIRKVIDEGKVVTAEDYLTRACVWKAYGEKKEVEKDITKAREHGAGDEMIKVYLDDNDPIWTTILIR